MRFSFNASSIFRYSSAIASKVNNLYNSLVTFTTGNIVPWDSVRPRSVERRHYSNTGAMVNKSLTWIASELNMNTGAIAAGDPVVTVLYSNINPDWQLVAIGFHWPRCTDGLSANVNVPTPDVAYVDWYEGVVGNWANQYQPGNRLPWGWGFGSDDVQFVSTVPAFAPPIVQTGGGPCLVTSLVLNSDWVSAGQSVERIGLFGASDYVDFNGKAALWVFIEDSGL